MVIDEYDLDLSRSNRMSYRLTRAELYERVWEWPVTKVAARLRISDVALHKICRKHDIPVPPQGHWAKLAAGKPVKISPLPKASDSSKEPVEIIGSPTQKLPEYFSATYWGLAAGSPTSATSASSFPFVIKDDNARHFASASPDALSNCLIRPSSSSARCIALRPPYSSTR